MKKTNRQTAAYWEKELRKRGLGVDQPLTDNSEGELAQVGASQGRVELNKDEDYSQLRKKIDGSDTFMSGFEIKAMRSLERKIPEWTASDTEIQKVLLTAFPRMLVDRKQRKRASKWARAIYLYYRMGLPTQVVAKELNTNKVNLDRLIQKITWVSQGLNTMGNPRKRKVVSPHSAVEGTGEKGDVNV